MMQIFKSFRPFVIFIILLVCVEAYISLFGMNVRLPSKIILSVHSDPAVFQVFYNRDGKGFRESDSVTKRVDSAYGFTQYDFDLPYDKINSVRIDLGGDPAPRRIAISEIRIESLLKTWRLTPPEIVKAFGVNGGIKVFEVKDGVVLIETSGADPFMFYKKNFSRFQVKHINALAIVALALLFGISWGAYRLKKAYLNKDRVKRILNSGLSLPVVIVLISVISGIVFFNFFVRKKLFIFADIGGDTLSNYWPYFIHAYDLIAEGDFFAFWTFGIGLGSSTFSMLRYVFDPFHLPMLIAGRDNLVYFLPYAVVAKVIFSGVFCWYYLNSLGLSRFATGVGALLYAFNGYLMLWGQHYAFGSFVVFVPLILWGFERILKRGKWLLFTVAIAVSAATKYYFLYMLCVFLLAYAPFRYFSVRRFSVRDASSFLGMFIGAFVMGIGLSAVMMFPSAAVIFGSSRLEQGAPQITILFHEASYYVETMLRMFSNDAMGVGSYYYGSDNYYLPHSLYSGLIALLLVPQVFRRPESRVRVLYGLFLSAIAMMVIFRYASVAMNFFSYPTYRWSFIIVISMVAVAAHALSMADEGLPFSGRLMGCTLFVLAVLGISAALGGWHLGWSTEQFLAVLLQLGVYFAFLICYAILLCLWGRLSHRRNLVGVMLVGLICIELTAFSWITNNDRLLLSPACFTERRYEFDFTRTAVSSLKKEDPGFFRIEKGYVSRWFADPLFQGYYGVTAYESLNQKSYMEFLAGMDLTALVTPIIISDYGSRTVPQTLVGVKYYLTRAEDRIPYGYVPAGKVQDVYMYRNENALPLGFAYDAYILRGDFDRLSQDQKDAAVLKGFVWDGPLQAVSGLRQTSIDELIPGHKEPVAIDEDKVAFKDIDVLKGTLSGSLKLRATSDNPRIFVPFKSGVPGRGSLTIAMDLNGDEINNYQTVLGNIAWVNRDDSVDDIWKTRYKIKPGRNRYFLSLGTGEIKGLRLKVADRPGVYTIENFAVIEGTLPPSYEEDVRRLKMESFEIDKFHQGDITGHIKISSPRMVFWSIPYDPGWALFVDGRQVEIDKINIGFIGARLDKGAHEIRLKYTAPGLVTGAWTSIVSLVVMIILLAYGRLRGLRKPS